MSQKNLYHYFDDINGGVLSGMFLATPEDVQELTEKTVYFGEVLGKYSDVEAVVYTGDIQLLSDNQAFIDMFIKELGNDFQTGLNPVEQYKQDLEDGLYEEDED